MYQVFYTIEYRISNIEYPLLLWDANKFSEPFQQKNEPFYISIKTVRLFDIWWSLSGSNR